MKKLTTLLALIAVSALAQDDAAVQTGTPVKLEAINGKVIRAMLQSLENDTVTFQPYKSNKTIDVGIDKVKHFEFYPKYDKTAVEAAFNKGEYAEVLAILDPMMEPFEQYMPVDNNLHPAFLIQMKAHYALGDFSTVRKFANLLLISPLDSEMTMQGKVYQTLSIQAEGDFSEAEKLRAAIEVDAARLYIHACALRAQAQPKQAMQIVVDIIAEHANEIEWLAPSELLSAQLYLDLGMTNSALNTARQVKNIYAGTYIAADAGKLHAQLQTPEE